MNRPIIEVEELSKLYRLGVIGATTLRDSVERWWYRIRGKEEMARKIGAKQLMIEPDDPQAGPQPNTIWALKDISFSVKPGEIIGIIGKNGAGKTTLLKILSRITEPTTGKAIIRGRTSSMLEVGTGFHRELTGRENVYLNGAILGMRKSEINRKFDEIVAFAELEKFIDTPVKRYSSGMYVRLAFAVAAHLEPEILLVDEVLSVGDASFQKKCLGKMGDVARGGRTVLFVSHNMGAINRLCRETMFLDDGRIQMIGDTQRVVGTYISARSKGGGERCWPDIKYMPGSKEIGLRATRIRNEKEKITDTIDISLPFWIEVEYEVFVKLPPMRIVVNITTADGTAVFVTRDNYDNVWEEKPRFPGKYLSRCKIPGNLLNAGCYTVTVSGQLPFVKILFMQDNVLRFYIQRTGGVSTQYTEPWPGVVCPHLQWDVRILEEGR